MYYQHLITQWNLLSKDSKGFIKNDYFSGLLNPEWEQEDQERERQFSSLPEFTHKIDDNIKQKTRLGIPQSQRRKWWFIATKGLELLSQVGDVWESALHTSLRYSTIQNNVFGGFDLSQHLPSDQQESFKQFLHVIWSQNPFIEFAPLIPTVAYLLLLFLEPPLAFLAIQSMIRRSVKDSWYFTLNRDSFVACVKAFRELAHDKCPAVVSHADVIGLDIAQIAMALFPVFFMPFMPLPVALTFFDSFCVEGRKVLVRCALNLILTQKNQLLHTHTSREFISVLCSGLEQLSDISSLRTFIQGAFHIYLSRGRHINKYEKTYLSNISLTRNSILKPGDNFIDMLSEDVRSALQSNSDNQSTDEVSEQTTSGMSRSVSFHSEFDRQSAFAILNTYTPEEIAERQLALNRQLMQKALPQVHGGSLLSPSLFCSIRNVIPPNFCHMSASLVFSVTQQGTALLSLFQAVKNRGPYIILVQTPNAISGAFLSDPPRPNAGPRSGRYFGKPYCFVFDGKSEKCYKVSKPPNNMFISVTNDCIIIGGPRAAIYIQNGFKSLISESCDTFGSPPLLQETSDHAIINVEVFCLREFEIESSSGY